MVIPSSYNECVELIHVMDKKIHRLQLDKRNLKMRLKVTPKGRSVQYKSKIVQSMILDYLHKGKSFSDLECDDNECRIENYTLKDFRFWNGKNI